MLATLMLMPSCLSGSVSPEMPERILANASSLVMLKNEAKSPASPVRSVDICRTASPESPMLLSMAPIVPVYCSAESSVMPKAVDAPFAHLLIVSAPSPNVTSTTFCTSCRSDASSTDRLVMLMIVSAIALPEIAIPIPAMALVARLLSSLAPWLNPLLSILVSKESVPSLIMHLLRNG